MANEKEIRVRQQQKHDIEANWKIAGERGFIPKPGEIIVYEADEDHLKPRIKIGNGIDNVNDLSFSSGVGEMTEQGGEIFNNYENNTAQGLYSHAEGDSTNANGWGSHTEGIGTLTQSLGAHAEGYLTKATNSYTHAEGNQTEASGNSSHSEGWQTKAIGDTSHAEGSHTQAVGVNSHAEGDRTYVKGHGGHAEGALTKVLSAGGHAEGHASIVGITGYYYYNIDVTNNQIYLSNAFCTEPTSDVSVEYEVGDLITIIYNNIKYPNCSRIDAISGNVVTVHALPITEFVLPEDINSVAKDQYCIYAKDKPEVGVIPCEFYGHAEGINTIAIGKASHTEGLNTIAEGFYTHAEGDSTHAIGTASHAEGKNNFAGMMTFIIQSAHDFMESQSEPIAEAVFTLDAVEGLAVGDIASIKSGPSYPELGTIMEITGNDVKIQGTKIADIKLLAEKDYSTETQKHFYVIDKPAVGTTSFDSYQHVEGCGNRAMMYACHAEGYDNIAGDRYAHAEGRGTIAYYAAHSEGYVTEAKGYHSHAEGCETKALENSAHSEGYRTTASGLASHAEGQLTQATNNQTHAEGYDTRATGSMSHAEGQETEAKGAASHTEGYAAIATGIAAHAEGHQGKATDTNGNYLYGAHGNYSHTEGQLTLAKGIASHAEGKNTTASGYTAHTEGENTVASGNNAHAEGYQTKATTYYAHAEGALTTASGYGSHAEGEYSIASKEAAHAEGFRTEASGLSSHTEGHSTKATKNQAHAEGYNTQATGEKAHAEGDSTIASGIASHASGLGTIASANNQTAIGQYNTEDANALFIVGNGSSSVRNNAFTVNKDGSATLATVGAADNSVVNVGYLNTRLAANSNPWTLDEETGCFSRTVGTEVEWLNPPLTTSYSSTTDGENMTVSGEYRTVERFMGEPVYTCILNTGLGVQTDNAAKKKTFTSNEFRYEPKIIRTQAFAVEQSGEVRALSYDEGGNLYWNIHVERNSDNNKKLNVIESSYYNRSSWYVYVQVWYSYAQWPDGF